MLDSRPNDKQSPNPSRHRLRIRWALLALGVLITCVAVTKALTAAPALADGTTILRNWQTGVCLDSDYGGDTFVSLNNCNFGTSQQWNITTVSSYLGLPVVAIQDTQTGLCLTSSYSWPGSSQAIPLFTSQCSAGSGYLPTQLWIESGNSYMGQYMNDATAQCLDNSGTALYTLTCNGGGYQNWRQGY
jgi:hypothetical protein